MKQVDGKETTTTIRVTKDFAYWLKIESAKSRVPMHVFLESKLKGAPKSQPAVKPKFTFHRPK